MNRAGRPVWAGRTAVLAVLLGATLLVLDAHDGFRSHAMLVFPGLLLISVMLLDRRYYLTTSGVILLAVAALGIAEKQGLTRATPGIRTPTSYDSIFTVDLTLAVFAIIGSRIAKDVQSDVSDLRAGIDQLSAANLELTRTAEALRESEERFRAIFFQAAVGIAQTDIDRRCVLMNDQFCGMLGYSQAELSEKTLTEVVHPDDCEASSAAIHRLLSGEISSWSQEKRYIRKDGATVWGRAFTSLVRDQRGQPKYLLTVVEDITEKIHAERALRNSEERLALAQNAAQLGVWDCDLRTGVITICGHYPQLHGLSPDRTTITREEWLSLIHPEDRERVDALTREAREQTHFFDSEFRVIWPQGSTHWLHARGTMMVDDAGRPSRTMGVVWDITERKQDEAKLRESEERFRRVFEEGPLGVALVGKDYHFQKSNSALCQMVGYSEEELAQKTFADITHPDDVGTDVALAEQLFRGEIPFYRMQKRYVKKNGEILWINLTASVIRGRDGEPLYGLAMVEDITEVKRTQEESFARQKLESVGTLASGIAHDFNNLLGGVVVQAELVLAELHAGMSPERGLKAIRDLAIRGSEIVRQLMIYAGKESEVVGLADVSQIVEEMIELLKMSVSKHAVVETDLGNDRPAVRANAAQLRQIVMNLVINASEAIGDRDGIIRVRIRRATKGRDAMIPKGVAEGDYLQLEVADTGCGMTPETQARVFDPFFTTRSAGHGLGLAVVHGIVRRLGGSINVASEPGEGTTFEVLLPCAEGALEAGGPSGRAEEPARELPQSTVLVVEDEDALRGPVTKLLRRAGFEVLEAADGHAAIDVLRADGAKVDVILLDLTIPGPSSHEVVAQAVQARPDVKVVLTSAYSEEMARRVVGNEQVRGFIRKPFQLSELVRTLRNVRFSASH
jgi:PAS domain S-box-containing protein